jgi:hypothetical protein
MLSSNGSLARKKADEYTMENTEEKKLKNMREQ